HYSVGLQSHLLKYVVIAVRFNNPIKTLNFVFQAERTRRNKVAKILDVVPRRGPKAFEHFYYALIVTGQGHLADLIWPERVTQTHAETASRKFVITHEQASTNQDDEDDDNLPEKFPTPDIADTTVIENLKDVQDPKLRALLTNPKEDTYQNFSKPKGRAVIINNVLFGGDKDRKGSEKDATQLQRLFEKLNYKVVTHSDLTAEKMLVTLKEESKLSDHEAYHSFVLIILSHGAKGVVYGTDWNELSLPVIIELFNGTNCPFLVNKPKLFFIQACQGENADPSSEDTKADGDFFGYLNNLELARREEQTDGSGVSVRARADILVAMATVPNYVSWHKESLGTWFIIALVYIISRFAHKYEICKLLTKVNHLVSKAETKDKCNQVARFSTSLRKDFYFFPGLHQS
ncbi:caspase-3, partial [Lingula anatina]|uniref:Caspase-3 n=1 Tax=Lingula anatina TaxID=7574 RepID=A0A1S3K319_LINAN